LRDAPESTFGAGAADSKGSAERFFMQKEGVFTMTDIIPFKYEGKAVRVLRDEQGEPWWVAVDVCGVLGIANARDALIQLDDDEKTQVVDPATVGIADGTGINNLLNVINEPGLYSLILRSRKPEAKPFKRWVTHEVLPQIRKTGSYVTPNASFTANIAKLDALRDANGFLKELAIAQRTYLQLYRGMRLKGPQLILAVQNAFRVNFGIELAQIAPLLDTPNGDGSYSAVIEDRLVTPTYLGKTLELRNPGKAANDLLEKAGLMARDVNKDPCPTSTGKNLGEWIETGKRHHSGAPILAWRWKECATLEKLRALA
jgi:prophage antirepressor-like protein